MIVDLSHHIETGMPFFPGDPEPHVTPAPTEPPWQVIHLDIGSHTGTHVDAAKHFIVGGRTIDEYPLERFLVNATVVPVEFGDDEPISASVVRTHLATVSRSGAVLFRTGWDAKWGAEQYLRHPYLSREAAEDLVTAGVSLVGIDTLNVDSTVSGTTAVHEVLLGSDVLIVENLTGLGDLRSDTIYRCAFVPLKISAGDGSPIRAFAWVDED